MPRPLWALPAILAASLLPATIMRLLNQQNDANQWLRQPIRIRTRISAHDDPART
jgi:hypothetical protein